jgi:hypothetical protein
LRRNSANAVNLYVKFNDFACDPLGEDPATPLLRERTRERLQDTDESRSALVPVIARRLDSIGRDYTRDGWREVLWATVFGEEPFTITEEQFEIIRAIDGTRNWHAVITAAANGHAVESLDGGLAELVERGVIDLEEAAA